MPRRIIESPCKCGCGQITRNGGYVRGHHTVTRWHLVNAATLHTETGSASVINEDELFGYYDSMTAGEELARRGWLLPDCYRHFGVEMEVIAESTYAVARAMQAAGIDVRTGSYSSRAGRGQWVVKTDGSLRANPGNRERGNREGVEVVSPPLRGKKGFAELAKVCAVLNQIGVDVNKTCGLHVHHEAKDFTLDAFKAIALNYAKHQKAIDAVLAKSRRSDSRNTYCKPFSEGERDRILAARDVRTVAGSLDRYHVLNLTSFASYGTVEFRQHQASVDFEKIMNWILAGQAMMRAAKKAIVVDRTVTFGELVNAYGTKPAVPTFFETRRRKLSGSRSERSTPRSDAYAGTVLDPAIQPTVAESLNGFGQSVGQAFEALAEAMRPFAEALRETRRNADGTFTHTFSAER